MEANLKLLIIDDSEKSLEMLEFPQVRSLVAALTSFSASRELALALLPSNDLGQVSRSLQLSAEARRLLATETGFTIGGITDIREIAGLAARGKLLEPPALLVNFVEGIRVWFAQRFGPMAKAVQ